MICVQLLHQGHLSSKSNCCEDQLSPPFGMLRMESVNPICTFVSVEAVSVVPMLYIIQAHNCWLNLSVPHMLSLMGSLLMQM